MEPPEAPTPPAVATNPDVAFSGVQETLLITLYAKWWDFHQEKPILGDRWAAQILDQIPDHDMETRLQGTPTNLPMVATRARCLDLWTAEFLAENETATVLHLACGLDTRCFRLQEKCGPGVRWIDLDVPDVVEARRKLISDPVLEGGYELIGASVTDTDWLERIPDDRPAVVVFEGLTMYLTPEEGKEMIRRIATHFPSGQLLFDALSSLAMNLLNSFVKWRGGWDVNFKWGLDDPKKVLEWHDRLELLDSVLMCAAPGVEEYPIKGRLFMYMLSWIPYVRYLFVYLRYKF